MGQVKRNDPKLQAMTDWLAGSKVDLQRIAGLSATHTFQKRVAAIGQRIGLEPMA